MSRTDEIRELTRIRVYSFLREPEAIFWVFVFPMVLAAVLGFAFRSGGPQPSTVALIQGPGSQEIAAALELDEELEVEFVESPEEGRLRLRKAKVDALIGPGEPPALRFDPVRPEAAVARLRILRALGMAEGATDPEVELDPVTEVGSRYVDFLFPGLLGMNLMGTGMWGIGFAIADVRRRKFLKRLLVTPMRRSSFFLSFMLSRLVFLAIELLALTLFAVFILGVPFRGDVISFGLISLIGAFVFAGLGILVASRARTIEGVSGLMNFVMMPMWLASGVFFSYERFPEVIHPFLRLLPLTALNDALRGIMIDGDTILQHWPEIAVMGGWSVLTFALALKIFRWE